MSAVRISKHALPSPRRLRLALWAGAAWARAWQLRLRRRMDRPRLGEVAASRTARPGDVALAVRLADRLAELPGVRTGRKCFVRSYVLATVLRRLGLPAVLNVGIARSESERGARGHCWLTVGGRVVAERTAAWRAYPRRITERSDGIAFWVGGGDRSRIVDPAPTEEPKERAER